MTIDDVRAAAEKAKRWRPKHFCNKSESHHINQLGMSICLCHCESCLGARRTWIDIKKKVDAVERDGFDSAGMRYYSSGWAEDAARISSYFCSEPNPVSEFRDTVRKFVEAGK